MIENSDIYRKFLDEFRKKENLTYERKLEIFEEMFVWSKYLGVFNKRDPLEGTEKNIRIAGILKKCLKICSSD
ncbi:hypothetical protein JW890_02480 [candidate division WOR-3 bacterium]|nr:hypothetical protein [candidate division WOR-3 bacterium]